MKKKSHELYNKINYKNKIFCFVIFVKFTTKIAKVKRFTRA